MATLISGRTAGEQIDAINGEITVYFVDAIMGTGPRIVTGVAITDIGYVQHLPGVDPLTEVATGAFIPELPQRRAAAFVGNTANGKILAHEIAHVIFNSDPTDAHLNDSLNVLLDRFEADSNFKKNDSRTNKSDLYEVDRIGSRDREDAAAMSHWTVHSAVGRILIVGAVATVMFGSLVLAVEQYAAFIEQPSLQSPSERKIFDLEARFLAAEDRQDRSAIIALSDDDYEHIYANGRVRLNALFAEELPSVGRGYSKAKSLRIHVSGRIAIVRGYLVAVENQRLLEVRYIRIWTRKGRDWKAFFYQETFAGGE